MAVAREPDPNVIITHPNRDSAAAKSTRALVVLLQVVSAALIVIVFIGSLGAQAGAQGLQLLIAVLFAYYAYAVLHWRSGVLPIIAGTAVLSGIFAAVSIPGWFDRGGTGYKSPPFPEGLIAVLVFAFVIVQFVNTVVAMRAFNQQWQVEVEVPRQGTGAAPLAA